MLSILPLQIHLTLKVKFMFSHHFYSGWKWPKVSLLTNGNLKYEKSFVDCRYSWEKFKKVLLSKSPQMNRKVVSSSSKISPLVQDK